jgi:uncharacterized RDD family membrane protein YckC
MPCPLCGDICRCSAQEYSAASPRWLPDEDVRFADPLSRTQLKEPAQRERLVEPSLDPAGGVAAPQETSQSAQEDSLAWRQEVAARLNRYQARRKPRPPRYPSLRLRFEQEVQEVREVQRPTGAANSIPVTDTCVSPGLPMVSNQALALERFTDPVPVSEPMPSSSRPAGHGGEIAVEPASQTASTAAQITAKIIEFPRSWVPAPAPLDELAEPVMGRPRILETPEVVPPAPALGGITIEPVELQDLEKRPGIDMPLQSAPLPRRMLSAIIDDLIIAAACALFGFIFWKLTAIGPPLFPMVTVLAGLMAFFWTAYQYLLVVYAGTTPGLLLARLELASFDGKPAGRRLRRWRVFASYLSAVSLGMGYAWVFLDEDSLCWHDRITHTYLAPRNREISTVQVPPANF